MLLLATLIITEDTNAVVFVPNDNCVRNLSDYMGVSGY